MNTYGVVAGMPTLVDNEAWSFGAEVVAGVSSTPLLMDEAYYQQEVFQDAWGGMQGGYHDSLHPLAALGLLAAVPVASIDRVSPELFVKVESAYIVGLDLLVTPSVGVRVGR